jgi:hypothetical protein
MIYHLGNLLLASWQATLGHMGTTTLAALLLVAVYLVVPLKRFRSAGISAVKNHLALSEKLSDFPSSAIRSSENTEICRLFAQSGSPSDGKTLKQDAQKTFTVRFTVKSIRLEAIDGEGLIILIQ